MGEDGPTGQLSGQRVRVTRSATVTPLFPLTCASHSESMADLGSD